MKGKRNKTGILSFKMLWLFTKYQILSKALISFIVLPVFSAISNYLIYSTGRTNISSGDFVPFLLSFQGIALLLISLFVITVIMGGGYQCIHYYQCFDGRKQDKYKIDRDCFYRNKVYKIFF